MAVVTQGLVRPLRRVPRGRPVAVDLFCGAGGLSVGLKQAGFDVVAALDLDPIAISSYKKNHRNCAVFQADIRDVTGRELLEAAGIKRGELDLLAGCPPCQGFSRIRTRNAAGPVNDPRNSLLGEFLRMVEETMPKTVMMENVPGLRGRRLHTFISGLRRRGYHVTEGVLNAADFGVPQRRRRLLVLASRMSKVSVPSPSRRRMTVRGAIGRLGPPTGKDVLHSLPPNRAPRILEMIRLIPKDGGSRLALQEAMRLPCHAKVDGFKDVYGRMKWDDVAPTITGGCINPSKGRFLHPFEDRAITLREAALLQTFPPGYRFDLRRGTYRVAEMIGNALPPRFIKAIASPLRTHLQAVPAPPSAGAGRTVAED